MYIRIILMLSAVFNFGLILKSMKHWCCDGGEYCNSIIILSFMITVLSFINFVLWFKTNHDQHKGKGE